MVDTGDSPVQEKLTGQATFPLLVFLIIILVLRIGTHLYKGSANTIKLVRFIYLYLIVFNCIFVCVNWAVFFFMVA